MDRNDALLGDWRERALALEREVGRAVIAQQRVIRLATTAVFARGHVLLQGDVGVGKTTLLRALAQVLGDDYARIEGTIDRCPATSTTTSTAAEPAQPAGLRRQARRGDGAGGRRRGPAALADPEDRPERPPPRLLAGRRSDAARPTQPGRGGTGEAMVGEAVEGVAAAGAGSEHLSALREAHLRLLAGDTGLGYHHLVDAGSFIAALTAPALARPVPARFELGPWLAGLALLLLLLRQLPRKTP